MKRRPRVLLSWVALLLMAACVPTSYVAEPDLTLRHPKSPDKLAPCFVEKLSKIYRDPVPDYNVYEKERTIALHAERGHLIAFLILKEEGGHSLIQFWNGNLNLEDPVYSGYVSDVLRSNWQYAEEALRLC